MVLVAILRIILNPFKAVRTLEAQCFARLNLPRNPIATALQLYTFLARCRIAQCSTCTHFIHYGVHFLLSPPPLGNHRLEIYASDVQQLAGVSVDNELVVEVAFHSHHCRGRYTALCLIESIGGSEWSTLVMNKSKSLCDVCGDRAVGYNFNGLSCESCKIFFRRHANRLDTFKCSKGNCKITTSTRNVCRRCRLQKCFDIGMKKELIDYKYTKRNKENELALEKVAQLKNTKESGFRIEDVRLPSQELEHLQEVQNAMTVFVNERKLPVVKMATDLTESMNIHGHNVRKIIKFCKAIEAFKSLSPADQLIILKGAHCDISCIRVSFNFLVDMDGFLMVENENDDCAVFVSLKVFDNWDGKDATPIYRNFLRDLQIEMEEDAVIRDLIIAKQLFLPREGLSFPEFVRYQHQMYVQILKLYLEQKYDSLEKAEIKYDNLVKLLEQLGPMVDIKRRMLGELNNDELTQEVNELFDLNF